MDWRLQVLLDPTVVVDLCGDRDGHGVSVLAAGKLPWPAVERRHTETTSCKGWAFNQVIGDFIFMKQLHEGSVPWAAPGLWVCTGRWFKVISKGSGTTHLLETGTFPPAPFPPTA